MTLQWRNELSVGNDLIDNDHKYLIDLINKAQLSLEKNNPVKLTAVLEELAAYGSGHFRREELIAHAVSYPQEALLHESHEALIANLHKFREEVGTTWTQAAAAKFTTFLRDWLILHVIKEDLPMKPWLSRHSPRFDPRV